MASIGVRARAQGDTPRPGSIRVVGGSAGPTVVMAGEIDATVLERAARVARRLADGPPPLVDCSGVTFFCAAGVAVLAELGAVTSGGAVPLTGAVPGVVREVLDACGLTVRTAASACR